MAVAANNIVSMCVMPLAEWPHVQRAALNTGFQIQCVPFRRCSPKKETHFRVVTKDERDHQPFWDEWRRLREARAS